MGFHFVCEEGLRIEFRRVMSLLEFPIALWPRGFQSLRIINQEFIMGKGNNSRKKEVKKPKKEKPKVLATRKTTGGKLSID